MNTPIRVLVAKIGLDGHDRGARVIASALRDAGMEVIYTGLRKTPEMIVRAAVQEDADVVGVSILSGAHMTLLPRLRRLMDDEGLDDVPLVAGGVIPEDDRSALRDNGIAAVFTPGTRLEEVVSYIRGVVDGSANSYSPTIS
ncbi:MAG TPA: cobalamin B12-binding domain-containing protein [Rhodothermales bacterium]|nr:cobalamin B12-binding domain-containing protein [Rhodothermales bacterium]